jgi:hypothetical protein
MGILAHLLARPMSTANGIAALKLSKQQAAGRHRLRHEISATPRGTGLSDPLNPRSSHLMCASSGGE